MRIEQDLKLDFKDVLIRPKRSTLTSRSEDDISREYVFLSMRFPLKLTSVTQVDSKSSPAVQIADVMIGAAMEAANGLTGLRSPLLDPQEVNSLYGETQFIYLVPSINFAGQKQFRQGTQAAQMIDYFAKNFSEGLRGRRRSLYGVGNLARYLSNSMERKGEGLLTPLTPAG